MGKRDEKRYTLNTCVDCGQETRDGSRVCDTCAQLLSSGVYPISPVTTTMDRLEQELVADGMDDLMVDDVLDIVGQAEAEMESETAQWCNRCEREAYGACAMFHASEIVNVNRAQMLKNERLNVLDADAYADEPDPEYTPAQIQTARQYLERTTPAAIESLRKQLANIQTNYGGDIQVDSWDPWTDGSDCIPAPAGLVLAMWDADHPAPAPATATITPELARQIVAVCDDFLAIDCGAAILGMEDSATRLRGSAQSYLTHSTYLGAMPVAVNDRNQQAILSMATKRLAAATA